MDPTKCETCEAEVVVIETIREDEIVAPIMYDYPPSKGVVVERIETVTSSDSGSILTSGEERGVIKDVYDPHVCDPDDITEAAAEQVPAGVGAE